MAKAFSSKAQMEKFKELVAAGKMSQSSYDESLALTADVDGLPERLHPKKEDPKVGESESAGS